MHFHARLLLYIRAALDKFKDEVCITSAMARLHSVLLLFRFTKKLIIAAEVSLYTFSPSHIAI